MNKLDRIYELMPAVYRERDAAEGYPLRALLRIINEQADVLEEDIQQLWDDLFIETCRTWVIPYIGDLVSNNLLYDATRNRGADRAAQLFEDLSGKDLRAPIAIRTRADVAKTIYYRRRKGTPAMLEELARDVTGWPAHAVEFFELLGWTQHLDHLRFQSRWVDVRKVDRMDRVGGAFDETSHTVDVRRISQLEGWHNIRNVGFFFWRLNSYPLSRVPAREAGESWRYHFSPLGNPAPLFTRWRREGDEAGLATELHVPAPIRPAFFYEDLVRYRNLEPPRPDFTDLYGLPDPIPGDPTTVCPECSFFIVRNGSPVLPAQNPNAPASVFEPRIVCRRLEPWPASQPVGNIIAVDVEHGRMAIGDGFGATENVDVYYHYGFSAEVGGGPYERQKWLVRPELATHQLFVRESTLPGAVPNTFGSLTSALAEWESVLNRRNTIITILDSRTYSLPAQVELTNENWLAIEAANRERPVLETPAAGLEIQVLPPANPGDPDRRAALTFGGVVIAGNLQVAGDMGRLRLVHSTLVPGRRLLEDGKPETTAASLEVEGGAPDARINAQLRVEIAHSITGPLSIPGHADGVWLLDSIVDGLSLTDEAIGGAAGESGPRLNVERTTIFGTVHCRALEASEVIFTGTVETVRTQEGCVRFSYVPPGSRTPRRYRCQPDLAVGKAINEALEHNPSLSLADQDALRNFTRSRLVPSFTTLQYGQPAYGQLRLGSPVEIRTGAEDGSEMGAFSHLKQPQRESNLRIRLEEYLPFGLEAGTIFVT